MRKLLFSSLLFLVLSCQQVTPTEKPIPEERNTDLVAVEAIEPIEPKVLEPERSIVDPIKQDSFRAIYHGSPDQEKLDSMKRIKGEKKSKG
jgi:hypothetical protein